MNQIDAIVVGGGAAGLLAAGFAAKQGAKVLLLDRNPRMARKVMITGKGRCNGTNDCTSFFAARMQQQQISVRGNSSFSSPTNDGVFRGTGNCVKSRKGKPRVSCFR